MVVGGPASYDTEEETDILWHLSFTVPIIVLEDTPGSSGRPKFEKFRQCTTAVILAMEQWREQVAALGYVRSEYFGLPQHWKATYDALTTSSDMQQEFRKSRKMSALLLDRPVCPDDMIVSFGCVKHAGLNNLVISHMQVAFLLAQGRIVLAIKTRGDEKIGEAELEQRNAMLQSTNGAWLLDFGSASLTEILRASKIAVFTGGATDSIAYALARKPAIYCTSKLVRELNMLQGVPDGGEWFVAKLGGNLVVDLDAGPFGFVQAVSALLTDEGCEDLRAQQEATFPAPPAVWDTAPKIAVFLEQIATKK
ncbi:MAG: hypothetical protein G01um101448_1000 [Parcubacteria group bacterium Gr01-1014_48]|nr:MAG: hypothetical protein Greene041614_3 [Parcubacteria group bacterium Greene0416_14]TSC72331.1 MAG: hypothetical protein G01um101448_1000 [Parcubacteria group bacterium Gr01-1014_48]TSD01751.1 MAG: hypothetical protein Greene101415_9 [Parcubacteria group bacterium Greene1014_15]TSD08465.1 MAG: hypothetical protein Greene07144_4 [Parcubacteria group bacterium Greene0714_4]